MSAPPPGPRDGPASEPSAGPGPVEPSASAVEPPLEPGEVAQRMQDALRLAGERFYGAAMDALADLKLAAPGNPLPLYGLSQVFRISGRADDADRLQAVAFSAPPDSVEAFRFGGHALRNAERFAAAARFLGRGVELHPDEPDLWVSLALTGDGRNDPDFAMRCYRRALELKPGLTLACANLGLLLFEKDLLDEGIALYDKALGDTDNAPQIRFNRSLCLLAAGRHAEGWADYEARLAPVLPSSAIRHHRLPRWDGGDLSGRSILVCAEQGIGDEILFARGTLDVIERAGRVVVECHPKLVPIFARSFPKAEVRGNVHRAESGRFAYYYDWLRTMPPIDCYIEAGSIVHLAHQGRLPLRDPPGYLVADPVKRAHWHDRLAALGPQPKVGICWRSQLHTGKRSRFYSSLEDWGPVFALPGITFVNVQYDKCGPELAMIRERFGVTVHDFPEIDHKNDLDTAAALAADLDLVISAPTAVAAMAGALGVPTLVLGNQRPWLPLVDGCYTYQPSVRVIFPDTPGDWPNAIAKVADWLPRTLEARAR
ncbi:hypothetical protein [Zavarzinia sp. CC-PAN008]|uniref:hypothetical protein n=1 Tax=Zavarzinia sp. CC-PAN008 TaxID=3243332 RepID=UPI003F7480D1